MKKIALLLALLLLVSCSGNDVSTKEQPEAPIEEALPGENIGKENNTVVPDDSPVGKPAPEFSLMDLDGETRTMDDYKGKLLILDFFTTGCVYCVTEMPDLMALQEEYPEELTVVLVNIGQDEETVQQFMEEKGITLPVLFDQRGELAVEYNFYGTPAHAFIDEEGNYLGRVMGMMPKERRWNW